jgi:putative redox protein
MLRSSEAPEDLAAWGRGCTLLVPLEAARSIAPRPMLFVQGTEDDRVPVAEARELAAAAQDAADLRLLVGAGHHLRADPRAVALLLGWLERQA